VVVEAKAIEKFSDANFAQLNVSFRQACMTLAANGGLVMVNA
jgi:hypothetical protein